MMTIALAIYGAVLSSIIAFLQIRSHFLGTRYIDIEVHRFLGTNSELVEFIISNRASGMTELDEIMIGNLGWGGDVRFHTLWGTEIKPYKGYFEEPTQLSLPYRLKSGETVKCNYSSEDANRDFERFDTSILDTTNSELFEIEVTHSRSRVPKRLIFQLDSRHLKCPKLDSDWRRNLSFRQRLMHRPRSVPYS